MTAQLAAINENYEEQPRDESDDYGLLKGFTSVDVDGSEKPSVFLAYKVYRKSDAPETQCLVLVYFSDRILNLKAEEIKLKVHLQDKYHTLPFILEAQTNFVKFNAS